MLLCVHVLLNLSAAFVSVGAFLVTIDTVSSYAAHSTCGVPQSSILKEFFFSVYNLLGQNLHTHASLHCTTAHLYSLKPHCSLTQ